jgi:hypothetical protein
VCAAIKQHLKMKRHEAVLKMQNKQQTPQSFKQAKVNHQQLSQGKIKAFSISLWLKFQNGDDRQLFCSTVEYRFSLIYYP